MFSNFKNIVNNSLQELERLGEESLANLDRQQRQEGSSASQGGGVVGGLSRAFSPPPRPSSAGSRPGINALGSGGDGQQRPVTASGSLQAIAAAANAGTAGVTQSSSPRDSLDGFPSFGLSGLKRSLSNMPRSSLDLSGIRSSFDGGSNHRSTSPKPPNGSVTASPSVAMPEGRQLADLPGTVSVFGSPSLSNSVPPSFTRPKGHSKTASLGGLPTIQTSPRPLKRRSSARAASFSMSGPYTPDTMMKQDPFFFTTLQGLPDELKQAAFTPLPLEDDEEFLEEMQSDLRRRDSIDSFRNAANRQPIALPQLYIPTSTPANSVPDNFRPASQSAPAFDVPGFQFPISISSARSPLASASELPRASLPPFMGQVEEREEEHEDHEKSPAPQDTPLPHFEGLPEVEQPAPPDPKPAHQDLSDPLLHPSDSKLSLPSMGLSRSPSPVLRTTSPRLPPKPSTPTTKDDSQATEASSTLTKLQSEREEVNKLLKKYTALSDIADIASLEAFLQEKSIAQTQASDKSKSKDEEIVLLQKKLQGEETLRTRIQTLESEVKEAKAASGRAETKAKEEEEKKAKSISLLKAVRQKLIKAEKDKEDAELLRDQSRSNEQAYSDELRATRQRAEQELLSLRSAQEAQLNKLRQSFDREADSVRATFERELALRKGQADLDMQSLRAASGREIAAREARINTLEGNLQDVRKEKNDLFDELQLKTAEVESAVAEQERVQVTLDEMRYESKEAVDRISALQDEVSSFKKARLDATRDEGHTRRLLSELEYSHADKLRTYEDRIRALEKERTDTEEGMARKLQDKLREVDRMRREIERRDAENGEENLRREERQARIDRSEALARSLSDKVAGLEHLLQEAREEQERSNEEQSTMKEMLNEQTRRITELESRNEELQARETQVRTSNKTLREELRRVQAGVLLSEKSRNPGVGYFSNFSNPSSSPPLGSPALSTNGDDKDGHHPQSIISTNAAASAEEEALNFEYVRNVILQFLEHKEMRPHLVSVLGVILHFTPAELRRLNAKASA